MGLKHETQLGSTQHGLFPIHQDGTKLQWYHFICDTNTNGGHLDDIRTGCTLSTLGPGTRNCYQWKRRKTELCCVLCWNYEVEILKYLEDVWGLHLGLGEMQINIPTFCSQTNKWLFKKIIDRLNDSINNAANIRHIALPYFFFSSLERANQAHYQQPLQIGYRLEEGGG